MPSRPTSGLLVEVNVSQHNINPVKHWLSGVGFGGGKPPSSLVTEVAETAISLATVNAAMKETKGF